MRRIFTPVIPTSHLEIDTTMELALHNLHYGLLKIQHVLSCTGGGEVYFLPTPDLSTTSNRTRWRSGFAYGGLLLWNCDRWLQFPELRPNGCGVLLGGQYQPFDLGATRRRIEDAKIRFKEDWDYSRGNHFIGLYRGDEEEWYFLLHGGTKSIKNRLGLFEGSQTTSPSKIFQRCKQVLTPEGPFHFLQDADAEEYYALFKEAEAAMKRQREALAEYLFPQATFRFHETHQGMLSPTAMALGSYVLGDQFSAAPFVPLMIAYGEPILLVEGGLNPENLTQPNLGNPRISPHGSGDYLSELLGFRCLHDKGKRVYEFHLSNGDRIISDAPSDLREGHRSREWALRALEKLRIKIRAELKHIETFQ